MVRFPAAFFNGATAMASNKPMGQFSNKDNSFGRASMPNPNLGSSAGKWPGPEAERARGSENEKPALIDALARNEQLRLRQSSGKNRK
jgi:hypothetical protein